MSQAGPDELRSADANRRAGVFKARKEVLLKKFCLEKRLILRQDVPFTTD